MSDKEEIKKSPEAASAAVGAEEPKIVETESKAEDATAPETAGPSKRTADEVDDTIASPTGGDDESKKDKKKKRRRNYDDLPPEEEEEKSSNDEDEGDELDDEKLVVEDDEDDDLQEIDQDNIITTGRRTRGKVIDYSKVAEQVDKEAGKKPGDNNDDDDEEDEDADFKEPEAKAA